MPNSFLESLRRTWQQLGESPRPYPAFPQTQAWIFEDRGLILHLIPVKGYLRNWDLQTLPKYHSQAKLGFQVVHIWEDIWQRHPQAVQGRVKALLGKSRRIYGRETKAARIEQPVLQQFLQAHHTNVSIQGKFKYGLFYGESLVAVAAFGGVRKLRFEGNAESSELIRFCNATGYTVVGGLSKLLKAFLREKAINHLMTYADREWSAGQGYERLGFQRVEERPAQQFWIDPNTWERHYPHRVGQDIPKHWLPAFNLGSWKYVKWLND